MHEVTIQVPEAVLDLSVESGIPVLRLLEEGIRRLQPDEEPRPVPQYHYRKEEWNA